MATLQNAIFVIFSCLLVGVKFGKATMLSFGVAQSICIQQSRFARRGVLEGPLTASLSSRTKAYSDCIDWDNYCIGKYNQDCPIFSRTVCTQPSARIIGGKEAKLHAWPSFVSIFANNSRETKCGGTILNRSWVLTAKHCVELLEGPFALAGSHYDNIWENSEQQSKIDRVVYHPDRPDEDGKLEKVDLALVQLKKPLEFTDKIAPVTLPSTYEHQYAVKNVTVVGKGVKEDGKASIRTRQANISLIRLKDCRKMAGNDEVINDWEICLHNDYDSAATCTTDAGGPAYLVEDDPNDKKKKLHVLIGVISHGIGNCFDPPRISKAVSVFLSLDWIKNHINN